MIVGRYIAHYRVVRRLGAGGMGEVYEAEDTRLSRKVAVKILPEKLAARPETLERFKREARALAALSHPNIVTIHSVEEAEGFHFLTMELVCGRALNESIPSEGLGLERFFDLSVALADALAAAHARGIGHRDLKPSNVMVDDQGRVKVIDFGLAKLFQAEGAPVEAEAPTLGETVDGGMIGTPAYMSPEQIEGRKQDHRSDLFSLGILLCEMATGQRPFAGESSAAIVSSILRDAPKPLSELKPELPEHLGRIVRRCLRKNPDERYQSAREIRNELKELAEEAKLPTRAEGAAARKPATTWSGGWPNNLPRQLTSFIGREQETAEVIGLLSAKGGNGEAPVRLLTLTGPGGTGKTRLALHAAEGLAERFPDGRWFVDLGALADPLLVAQAAVSAMGLINAAGLAPQELLKRCLAGKESLLLLDNCEHLVAACAELAEALLQACPQLVILATSREALRLRGETLRPVPALTAPNLRDWTLGPGGLGPIAECESVQLFVERAKAGSPRFELTPENAELVAQLCHRLDGIPLAIELAAARIRLLPIEQLLARVQISLQVLTGGSRTALPRQQTLRALIDWSYELLCSEERLLFERLSIFAGGWTLEAAEAVCGDAQAGAGATNPNDVLALLGNLLEKSMAMAEPRAGGAIRYRLLETLRQYGRQRLEARGPAEAESLRARHTAHFVALAEKAALGMHGPDQPRFSELLEAEHDNIRAGLEWAKAAETPDRVELSVRLAAALYVPWFRQGHGRELKHHCQLMIARPEIQRPSAARARLLFVVGSLALWQDGDAAAAKSLLEESRTLAEKFGDTLTMANARHNLGTALSNMGDRSAARRQHEEALALAQKDDDANGIRWSLEDLGDLAAEEGSSERAAELYRGALSFARKAGDLHGVGSILQSMGMLARARGRDGEARELIGEGLSAMERIGCRCCSVRYLGDLASMACAAGDLGRAVRLLGAAHALRERTGIMPTAAALETFNRSLDEAREGMTESEFSIAWKEGRAMSLAKATAFALSSPGNGRERI